VTDNRTLTSPDIIILGAGGHGRVVLDIILQAKTYRPIGFLDNNPALHSRRIDGLPVLGGIEQLPGLRARGIGYAVIAIGDNGVRRALAEQLVFRNFDLVNAIHPSAQLATTVTLGKGVVIAAGALVCAHCQIGDYAILNTGCIVDHESMIGCSAHICPGVRLAGHVTVESGVFVGIGATVVQNVRLGYESIVGAGAVVTENVAPMTTVVGVPARPTKLAEEPGEFASMLTAGALPLADRIDRPHTPRLAPQPLRK
jgi:sugar O-acyltransferase (sialic acid O-acetyltransferase NeuD family)